MRVFVTGATGFVGSAVVKELLAAGHQVLGMVRSDASAKLLSTTGAQVHRGDVEDLESLRAGVAQADGVIHTAFNHDFSRFQASCEADRRAIAAMADELKGTDHPFIITSGTALLSNGKLATEDMVPTAGSTAIPRIATEEAAMAALDQGVRTTLIRLSPSVHGEGDTHGFVPALIRTAREKGVSAYIGDGLNRWPAVHRLDAALLYRLALEKGTGGNNYHAVDDTGIPLRDIAELIGNRLGVPVVSKTREEAADHFGWLAHFAAVDNPSDSKFTRDTLGWQPTQPGLLADMQGEHYFKV